MGLCITYKRRCHYGLPSLQANDGTKVEPAKVHLKNVYRFLLKITEIKESNVYVTCVSH